MPDYEAEIENKRSQAKRLPRGKTCPKCESTQSKTIEQIPYIVGEDDSMEFIAECSACGARFVRPASFMESGGSEILALPFVVLGSIAIGGVGLWQVYEMYLRNGFRPAHVIIGLGSLAMVAFGVLLGIFGIAMLFSGSESTPKTQEADDSDQSSTILIPPRQISEASRNWKQIVTVPEGGQQRRTLGLLVTTAAYAASAATMFGFMVATDFLNNMRNPLAWLLAIVSSALFSAIRYGKRLRAPDALQLLQRDKRSPVLVLRSFIDDGFDLPGFTESGGALHFSAENERSFEEFLCELFGACGPVIGIGQPGQEFPPIGFSRLWVSDDKWKQVVDELLEESQYVVMTMGRPIHRAGEESQDDGKEVAATGLQWEIERIFGSEDASKIVLVMPPVSETEAKERWNQYREILGDQLPEFRGGEIAATFDANGKPSVARMRRRSNGAWPDRRFSAYDERIITPKNAPGLFK